MKKLLIGVAASLLLVLIFGRYLLFIPVAFLIVLLVLQMAQNIALSLSLKDGDSDDER